MHCSNAPDSSSRILAGQTGLSPNLARYGGWPHAVARLLAAGIVVLYVLFFPDKRSDTHLTHLGWLLALLAALTDRAAPVRPRLKLTCAFYLLTLSLAAAASMAHSAPTHVWPAFFKYQLWVLWLISCWLCSPYLLALFSPRSLSRGGPDKSIAATVALLMLFGFICLTSTFASNEPKLAMKLFGAEFSVYLAAFLLLLRLFESPTPLGGRALCLAWSITLAAVAVMTLVLCLYATGGKSLTHFMASAQWIRVEPLDAKAPWRLQFPFEHHNRTAFFSMSAVFLILAGVAAGRKRLLLLPNSAPLLGTVGSCAAVMTLIYTVTRGALLAALAGGGIWMLGMLPRRGMRRSLFLLPALPLLWFVLPANHQHQLSQIFSSKAYHQTTETTIGSRLLLWQKSAHLIADRPLFGYGYGYENYEKAFATRYAADLAKLGGTSHAHNQWLEICAEAGLPAAAVFALFTLARLSLLLAAWRKAYRRAAPIAEILLLWLALEIAIQVYGLTNYPLRRSLGLFTYAIWAISLLLASRSMPQTAQATPAEAQTPDYQLQ